MGGCRIGGDGAWCCQSVTVNGTDLGLLPPAGRSFASRCVAADRDITVRDPAFCGELLPLVHAVRRCIHADAKLDAAIALRLLPRRGRRPVATEVAVACTQPRAHPRPRARPRVVAWRCICMGARHIGAYYAVRCPHHTTAPSHRAKRRWPTLIASRPRKNRSMQLCFHSTSYGH